jgi:hypothetical protein
MWIRILIQILFVFVVIFVNSVKGSDEVAFEIFHTLDVENSQNILPRSKISVGTEGKQIIENNMNGIYEIEDLEKFRYLLIENIFYKIHLRVDGSNSSSKFITASIPAVILC